MVINHGPRLEFFVEWRFAHLARGLFLCMALRLNAQVTVIEKVIQ